MNNPTKKELITVVKFVFKEVINNYRNNIIKCKYHLFKIITDILWEVTLHLDINIYKAQTIQRFLFAFINNNNTFPITETTLLLKISLVLSYLQDHQINEILEVIPNYEYLRNNNTKHTYI